MCPALVGTVTILVGSRSCIKAGHGFFTSCTFINELVQKGAKDGWLKIKKSCTISITKGLKIKKGNKRAIRLQFKMDSPLVDLKLVELASLKINKV